MATLFVRSERGRPVRMLQLTVPGAGRKTLRLGRLPQRAAERLRDKVEELAACRRLNQAPDPDLVAWLAGLDDGVYASLADAGLAEPRGPITSVPALGQFMAKHIDQKSREVSARSVQLMRQTEGRLLAHFGPAVLLDRLTPDGAADWRAALLADGLSEATVRLHTRNAKMFMNDAVERELVARNPFRHLPSASIPADRDNYVPMDEAEAVMTKLPDSEWRLFFGLARYAGLRVHSETHTLTWDAVDLDGGRMTVFAPKTGATRIVPIIPRLRDLFDDVHARRDLEIDTVLTLTTNNLHRTIIRAIEAAGLKRWPDLFQQLRRSCETDFATQFPHHVAAAWLGHSPAVSAKFYLQVPGNMYDEAAGLEPSSALHPALQHRTARPGTERKAAPPSRQLLPASVG